MPLIIICIFTPAWDASLSRSMISRSVSELIFTSICASLPCFAFSISLRIYAMITLFMWFGATIRLL